MLYLLWEPPVRHGLQHYELSGTIIIYMQGLIQGGWIGWLAPPPLECAVSITTIEQTILVNKVYDEMLIIHSDRE